MSSLPYFFFGTLMDADVRAIVLGREADHASTVRAFLEGYERLSVADESYPTLRPAPGGLVDGLLAYDLGTEDERRIAFFEGAEYELVPKRVKLASGAVLTARLFLDPGDLETADPWDFAAWQQRDKSALLEAARHFMRGFESGADRVAIDENWRTAWRRARAAGKKG